MFQRCHGTINKHKNQRFVAQNLNYPTFSVGLYANVSQPSTVLPGRRFSYPNATPVFRSVLPCVTLARTLLAFDIL